MPRDIRLIPILRHQSGDPFGRTFQQRFNYGTVAIKAEPRDAQRSPNVTVFDIRGEKAIRIRDRRVVGFFDVYNVFNSNAEQVITTTSGTSWLRPIAITPPRIARVGSRIEMVGRTRSRHPVRRRCGDSSGAARGRAGWMRRGGRGDERHTARAGGDAWTVTIARSEWTGASRGAISSMAWQWQPARSPCRTRCWRSSRTMRRSSSRITTRRPAPACADRMPAPSRCRTSCATAGANRRVGRDSDRERPTTWWWSAAGLSGLGAAYYFLKNVGRGRPRTGAGQPRRLRRSRETQRVSP